MAGRALLSHRLEQQAPSGAGPHLLVVLVLLHIKLLALVPVDEAHLAVQQEQSSRR